MHLFKLCIITLGFAGQFFCATAESLDSLTTCRKAFMFKSDDFAGANTIKIRSDADQTPVGYEADLNMPVCDDKLCANVYLKIYWDLAGNYSRFDTISGKALTKFDHKPFTDADYKKLDQILKDRNSTLRILEKNDLIDKSVKLRATTVDAVTGATPKTIKNAVVEGAVYSSYALWHFVNGSVKDSIRSFTFRIYSEKMARRMLESNNFETQLFALRQMKANEFEDRAKLLFQVIRKSSPLIRAYIINNALLPFQDQATNSQFVSLFPELDGYSKSIFLDRIISEKRIAATFLPLMLLQAKKLDERQLEKLKSASEKYKIDGFNESHGELH